MTNEKPKYDPKKLTEIAVLGYHAITGDPASEELRERIGAGVEALVRLYDVDPRFVAALGETIAPYIERTIDRYFHRLGLADPGESSRVDINRTIGRLFEEYNGE